MAGEEVFWQGKCHCGDGRKSKGGTNLLASRFLWGGPVEDSVPRASRDMRILEAQDRICLHYPIWLKAAWQTPRCQVFPT
jgi:hypothetical protein